MLPLLSEEEMDVMYFGDETDDDYMYTEMSGDIRDGSQSHRNVNRKEACHKVCDRIKQIQSEWKGALGDTRDMVNGLQKVFKTVVK